MAFVTNENKPKNIKVFTSDEFEKLLKGVKVAACMLTETTPIVDEASVIKRVSALTLNGPSSGDQCSCCGAGPFETRAQQISHYKHHWHAYNLKRRLFGKNALTLAEFNTRQDDNSGVSGSDSEVEESGSNDIASDLFAAATRHCKAFFTNSAGQVFCIYRCILHHRKEVLSSDGEGYAWVSRCQQLTLPGYLRWAVLMVSGGHFAGAIFSGGTPALHKTLHSYIVRRGQGQAQGTRDQHGNAPRSAGASLRRYNQSQFIQHVQEILMSWSADLLGCSLILYRAVGPVNQRVIFGKGAPLNRDDQRIRALPFPTRNPTYKEVLRAHATVANIEVYETMELFQKALIASTRPLSKPNVDGSNSDRSSRKVQKTSPTKPVNRAKSREPVSRELPIQITSSEDEGPCFIDSETPADWIKTLSEQSSNGVITNSRKDLLIDNSVASESRSSSEERLGKNKAVKKVKKKKKPNDKQVVEKITKKIPMSIKKIWKAIKSKDQNSLDTILELWEEDMCLDEACNTPDPTDGNTALHKAAIAANPEMVKQILTAGGDPCIRNNQQLTPYAASSHQDTRIAFRVFQASFPEKYNYAKSHIPGPITPELMEQEKERKSQQRKAKRQREKEKQNEKLRLSKFLQMTDSQKVKSQGECRCFLCGVQLPKKPFEYGDYKFCTMKCLHNHRNLRPLNLSA